MWWIDSLVCRQHRNYNYQTKVQRDFLIRWRTKFNTTHQVNLGQLSRDKTTWSVFSLEYYYDTANGGHRHHDTRSTVLSTSTPDFSLYNVSSSILQFPVRIHNSLEIQVAL